MKIINVYHFASIAIMSAVAIAYANRGSTGAASLAGAYVLCKIFVLIRADRDGEL